MRKVSVASLIYDHQSHGTLVFFHVMQGVSQLSGIQV